MGNIDSQCEKEQVAESYGNEQLKTSFVEEADFNTWCASTHEKYRFPKPCVEYHSSDVKCYSAANCYSLEVKVGRRRSVQFRHDFQRYMAELESGENGQHSMHVRDFITGNFSIIPLAKVASHLTELDYLHEPVVTVIAYLGPNLVLSVQEKSKHIPKALLFCNVQTKQELGGFAAQLNYNNLSGVLLDCCVSPDDNTFLLSILEDHYDQFQVTYHAIQFDDECRPSVLCTERFNQVWYEPSLLLQFLPGCESRYVIGLGENPAGLSYSDTRRYLFVYDLIEGQVNKGITLQECLYPVCLNISNDGEWLAAMFRDPSQQSVSDESGDCYLVKVYDPQSMSCQMQKPVQFTSNGFTMLSNCNKLVFSENNQLLALPSSDTVDDIYVDFEFASFYSPEVRGIEKVTMTIHWLPIKRITLKELCRQVVLRNCLVSQISDLPVPPPVQSYLQFLS